MTATIDKIVQAAAPLLGQTAKQTTTTLSATEQTKRELEREARKKAQEAKIALWKTITENGGIEGWLKKQLVAKGFSDSVDPSKLSGSALNEFKLKKKAEAEERRALKKQAWQAYQATHITHLGVGVHWDDKATTDKFDIENREARAKANDLPDLKNPDELAKALGLTISQLRWMTFHRDVDNGTHYHRWGIPKRDGTLRTITAPKRTLKIAQRWTLRNIVEKLPVHAAAHGFLSARSIVTNAEVHAGAHTIVKFDIKDFFPTVSWRRVRGLLRKAGLSEQVATLLSLLSTESPREVVQFRGKTLYVASGPRSLPQGAPTSPGITNAICMRLDRRMAGLGRSLGFRYTRYADDLTFSWNPTSHPKGTFPKAPLGILIRGVKQILKAEGFQIHPTKTAVMRRGNRQKVTGLVVNKTEAGPVARVPRATLRKLRAAIHNREVGKALAENAESLSQLKGMAAFVFMTDPVKGKHFLDRIAALESKETPAQ